MKLAPGNITGNLTISGKLTAGSLAVPAVTWTALPYGATWGDFAGGNQVGQYSIDSLGFVYVRGLVKSTGALTANTSYTIATLPAGFRPAAQELFSMLCNSSAAGGSCQVNIGSGGVVNVVPAAAVAANGWVTLSGIFFMQVN